MSIYGTYSRLVIATLVFVMNLDNFWTSVTGKKENLAPNVVRILQFGFFWLCLTYYLIA